MDQCTQRELRIALDRLVRGKGTEEDRGIIAAALASGQIALERGVTVGGDAAGATIVTGDGNVLLQVQGDQGRTIRKVIDVLYPPLLHQLPPPPADFTGRQIELQDLRRCIGRSGAAISGLRGMGGIGKTALALVLARELASRYPDAQLFLDLKGAGDKPLRPEDALSSCVSAPR